jgi:hypothetical protein
MVKPDFVANLSINQLRSTGIVPKTYNFSDLKQFCVHLLEATLKTRIFK